MPRGGASRGSSGSDPASREQIGRGARPPAEAGHVQLARSEIASPTPLSSACPARFSSSRRRERTSPTSLEGDAQTGVWLRRPPGTPNKTEHSDAQLTPKNALKKRYER